MQKVYLHCPLNVSRTLVQMISEYGEKMQDKYGEKIEILDQPHRPEEKSLFETDFENDEFPDMIIGHVNDFAALPDGYLEKYFLSIPDRFPIRKELEDMGFKDDKGYFHPFTVIPFAYFYNVNLLEEKDVPKSWEDLLNDTWSKKIRMPDEFRMVSIIIRTFMRANYPERFSIFNKNAVHSGSPIDVVQSVDKGEYPLGITNIAFARISKNKNTKLIWPKDGFFCMPQVMVFSKKADKRLLELGDFLMGKEVQEYLALQSFIPASAEIEVPKLLSQNNYKLYWDNWDNYLKVIKEGKGF
ncbi:ABC transporter substrate-binding protein [Anaerovorax odorimutans]|uniref:ABC transporter substrate-binding protein n=1 Tax=Anaerovorax odorimutans TaxID=109327 RepID=UPI00040587E3|nr:ABC transporter substrate-binding protein [Anaerovorax odorimutans]